MEELEYNGVKFEAIIATPGCGKSYLGDKYDWAVDVDEERLRLKYYVAEDITRDELERTKGNRNFEKRKGDYRPELFEKLDQYVKQGKLLIAAPHPESYEYLKSRNIKFCFVYAGPDMKEELVKRMTERGNSEQCVKENDDLFYQYRESNINDTRADVKYEFGKHEYLEDILKKFGCKRLIK